LSLLTFSGTIAKNPLQTAGIFFVVFIIFNLLLIFPNLSSYNPMNLSSLENLWISKEVLWGDAFKNIFSTLFYSFVLVLVSIILFEKQEL